MKREIVDHFKYEVYFSGTFNNRRSKKARSKYKKAEHRHIRRIKKLSLNKEVANEY